MHLFFRCLFIKKSFVITGFESKNLIQFRTVISNISQCQIPNFEVIKFHLKTNKTQNGTRKSNGETGNFGRCGKI